MWDQKEILITKKTTLFKPKLILKKKKRKNFENVKSLQNLPKLSNKFNFIDSQIIDSKYIITDDIDLCGDTSKKQIIFGIVNLVYLKKNVIR